MQSARQIKLSGSNTFLKYTQTLFYNTLWKISHFDKKMKISSETWKSKNTIWEKKKTTTCITVALKVNCLKSFLQQSMKAVAFLVLSLVMMGASYADDDDDGCEIIFGPNIGDTLPRGERVFVDPCVFCDCPDDALPGTHASCDRIRCPPVPRNCTKPVQVDGECCVKCE